MRLKRLEITGFKSFYEKCQLDFPYGITAIVGPNGCGKSNIVDALLWVMGEQSVKQLRGKSMEDVIFSGTNGTAPLNMAEVNLILHNDNGSAPEELRDFTEIMLTRRLYRSGESSYLLNKQPCRLKDIRDVFLGSGMGTKSYATIQQGNIGTITEANPDERRYFIEEAAGTTRFKTRKQEALRKIKATKRNLLRLDDLLVEIKRQMNSLKRQAGKARRYKKFRAKARALDIHLNLLRYDDHAKRISKTEEMLETLRTTDASHMTSIKKIDAAIEEIKLKRHQKNEAIADKKSKKFELQRTIDRQENTRSHLTKETERLAEEITQFEEAKETLREKNNQLRSEIEQTKVQIKVLEEKIATLDDTIRTERKSTESVRVEQDQLNQSLETAKTDLMDKIAQETRYKNIQQHASGNKENLKRRLKAKAEEVLLAQKACDRSAEEEAVAQKRLHAIREQNTDMDREIDTDRHLLGEKTEALRQQVKKIQALKQDQSQISSRHAALMKMEANFEWYRDGVKAVMALKNKATPPPQPSVANEHDRQLAKDIVALTADVIVPDPSYEVAVEAVLGDALQYVLVDNRSSGLAAVDYLKRTKAGRGGFIPINDLTPAKSTSPNRSGLPPLLDFVSVPPPYREIAQHLMGHVDLADNLTIALDHIDNRFDRTIVTLEGDLLTRQGVVIGGGTEKLGGILTKKQEIKQLAKQLNDLELSLNSFQSAREEIENEVKSAENRLQKHISEKNQLVQEETEAEKNLFKAEEALKSAHRHFEIVQLEHEQLLGEDADLDEELNKYDHALADVTAQVKSAQQTVASLNVRIQEISEEIKKVGAREMDLKLERTATVTKRDNHRHSLRRLSEFQDDQEKRYSELTSEIETKRTKNESAKKEAIAIKEALLSMYQQLDTADKEIQEDEDEYRVFNDHLNNSEMKIAGIRDDHEKTREEKRLLEIDLSELTTNQHNIVERLRERYHKTISGLQRELEAPDTDQHAFYDQDLSPDELAIELETLQQKISALGDVNMGAISEYQTLETRFQFLTGQRDDLDNAIEGLYRVIQKINRITQKRFGETMTEINEQLKVVFPKLFEGGTAKLVLTEPDKPLESGVEYMIQPPGKKLTRMSLLSGGEKALSAIAFVFSIFLIRPASFCFLDEIDAPLDEANVLRFNDLIKTIGKKSQIVMITHNKKSMEFAETLFGVTMPKKGVSKIVSVNFSQAEA